MKELTLTRRAAECLYASAASVIVADTLNKGYQKSIPEGVSVLMLHPSGLVACKSEKDISLDAGIPFIGLPTGLLGFVVPTGMGKNLTGFLEYAQEQKPKNLPEILEVSSVAFLGRSKLTHYFNKLLSRDLAANRSALAGAERQLVALRDKNEQLSLGFEKARRMIVGAGYSSRTICFDLPAGTKTVGTKENEVSHAFSQILPVDLASFTGVSLFVAEAGTGKSGTLLLMVRRRSDSAIIGAARVPYESFKPGWHYFALPEIAGRVFGDGILQMEWQGAGGPHFALADEIADRFGAADGSTLALRIERGLAEPSRLTETTHHSRRHLCTRLDATTLAAQGHFFGGADQEAKQSAALGSDVLRHDPSGRWLQIHALREDIAGLLLPAALPVGAIEVRASVSLAHRKAGPCIAFMVTGPDGALTSEAVASLTQQFNAEGTARLGQSEGLSWCATILMPGCNGTLDLSLPQAATGDQDLLLAVLPLIPGKNDRSWCRWQHVTINQNVPDAKEPEPLPTDLIEFAGSRAVQIRTHRFPEIADHLNYYKGKQSHIALREELGFWPIEFSDDTGAMQLHPLNEGTCAAVLGSGLPENVQRVACDVGTAHGQADDFIYVMGVLRADGDIAAVIDKIAGNIQQGSLAGKDADATEWVAVRVAARQKRTLELRLEQPSGRGNTVFFATLPATEGKTSYGWCRWYLLSFEMVPDFETATILETEPLRGAVGE